MKVEGHEIPQRVLDAFKACLQSGDATAGQLVRLAETFKDCPHPMRAVDRWLQQQRKAGTASFKPISRAWHWIQPSRGKHGTDCPKVIHIGEGYLHAADDDRPYHVDGVLYCGRCHGWMET